MDGCMREMQAYPILVWSYGTGDFSFKCCCFFLTSVLACLPIPKRYPIFTIFDIIKRRVSLVIVLLYIVSKLSLISRLFACNGKDGLLLEIIPQF
jgi:hypothetical protein